ncbi:MAG TPA: hypothetical protein VHD95_15130 [Rhizomicrobium sp.]|nr:hypothetical protein [Rhizomicrobium sp.]
MTIWTRLDALTKLAAFAKWIWDLPWQAIRRASPRRCYCGGTLYIMDEPDEHSVTRCTGCDRRDEWHESW